MFPSPSMDKENVFGDAFGTTPNRQPLKTVQALGTNIAAEGTPMSKRTPKKRSSRASTPCTRRLARRLKRQSMPFALSKTLSIFEDDVSSVKGIFNRGYMKENGQELNEMIRDKVSETVNKMKERYEVTLARKQKDLDEKNSIIKKLEIEMDIMRQESQKNKEQDNISMFVQQVISNAVQEIEQENCSSITEVPCHVSKENTWQSSSTLEQKDSWTTMTPTKYISSETSPMKVTDTEFSMIPIMTTNSATPITEDAMLSTPSLFTDSPTLSKKSENFVSPIQNEDYTNDTSISTTKIVPMKESSHVNIATAMTPVEAVDKHTYVTPTQTSNVSITTSPLVAALQPGIISSLPLNILRAELESAAISNELLRSECDELNGKVDLLQSSLTQARQDSEMNYKTMQDVIDNLEVKLEEALEANYEMQMKKPFTADEYDATIKRLQKDILVREKQITFYTKKSSEADNLQKDLRRMYAKYNAEHQLYTSLEDEMNKLTEQYNGKCAEYEALQTELSCVKEELHSAQHTIDVQDKLREEAKESQVKCCVLEEQIQTFQSQQKENLEFLEQERKGLEETTIELEQLVSARTEELDLTRQALVEKSEQYEDMKMTVDTLRSQLSDTQDELNAVQSQAYLVMLEQEKELTAVSRVLEETWTQVVAVVGMYKEEAIAEVAKPALAEPEIERRSQDIEYKPSLVYSVLSAVSRTVPQSADNTEKSVCPKNILQEKVEPISVIDTCGEASVENKGSDSSEDFELVSRAKAFQELLFELEEYVQRRNEHAQMIIKEQLEEIANLKESLSNLTQEHEEKLRLLRTEMASERDKMMRAEHESNEKQCEIETLKLELKAVKQNFETSSERMEELGNRCCAMIEQETENQVLNEKLRLVHDELEKTKQDKRCLETEMKETMDKLQTLVEASELNDEEKQTVVKESFAELLNKKLRAEREVDKLRSSFAKGLKENETFAHCYARLENKATILRSNLLRAEEEIYRLDAIVDRFCKAVQTSWHTLIPSQDLRDLLKELKIAVE